LSSKETNSHDHQGDEKWINNGNVFKRERTGPALNLWRVPEGESQWLDEVYDDCYKTDMTRRGRNHRNTFNMVLANLSAYECPVVVHLDRHHLAKIRDKPEHIAPNSIDEICRKLSSKGYVALEKGYSRNDGSTEPTLIVKLPRLIEAIPQTFKSHVPIKGVLQCKGFKRPLSLPQEVLFRMEVARQHNLLHPTQHQIRVIYTGDFDSHGRFYGDQVQWMNKSDRPYLRINGEPTAEIDVRSSIPYLYHALHVGNVPDDDLYSHPEVPRDLMKLVYMFALNCDSRQGAMRGLQGKINLVPEWGDYRAKQLLPIIEGRAPNAIQYLYKNIGTKLMNIEAGCLAKLLEGLNYLKIKRHPIHDSVICAQSVSNTVMEMMRIAFTINGYRPHLKVKMYGN